MLVPIIVILVIVIFMPYLKKSTRKKMRDKIIKELETKGFVNSKMLEVTPAICFFVDDVNKKIAIQEELAVRIYDYKSILSYELNDGGESILKGSMTGAIVGGLAFGVVGAVVGAAGSSKKQETSALFVRILINDLNCPQETINFLDAKAIKGDKRYQAAMERAKSVMATLKYIENQIRETTGQNSL